MKSFASALVLTSALMIGCSSGSNSSSSPFTEDFKPNEKPQNAAPLPYAKELFQKINNNKQVLPKPNAIFNAVIDGSSVKRIYPDSTERNEAIADLNADGVRFLKDINEKCVIHDATTNTQGAPAKGATVHSSGAMSTSGTDCPFVLESSFVEATTYSAYDISESTFNIAATITRKTDEGSKIFSNEIQQITGFKSVRIKTNTNSNLSFQGTSPQDGTIASNSIMIGSFEMILADGNKISGPLNMQFTISNSKTNMQFLLELQSPQGMIRVVLRGTSDSKTPELYINGEKVDPTIFPGLNLN